MKIFIGLACLAVVTSAGFVSKKYSFKELSVPKSKCGLQEVVCPTYPICCPLSHPLCCGEKCCRANQPYCCPDGIYCAETAEDCPQSKKTPNLLRKKALPKKLSVVKTTLGPKENKNKCGPTECPSGCCPIANGHCCPDDIHCTEFAEDCPLMKIPNLLGKNNFPKNKLSEIKSTCPPENTECYGGCCQWDMPYCCRNSKHCAATAYDCPSMKTPNLLREKTLPKKLSVVKTPLGSKGPECPTECGGGRCCPANWYCCPDNRWCAWTLADC